MDAAGAPANLPSVGVAGTRARCMVERPASLMALLGLIVAARVDALLSLLGLVRRLAHYLAATGSDHGAKNLRV